MDKHDLKPNRPSRTVADQPQSPPAEFIPAAQPNYDSRAYDAGLPPYSKPNHAVLRLQSVIGNQAVQRLLIHQPKSTRTIQCTCGRQSMLAQADRQLTIQRQDETARGGQAELTVYVLGPHGDSASMGSGAGHAWVGLTSPEGESIVRGFWPACAGCQSTANCPDDGLHALFGTPGQLCNDAGMGVDRAVRFPISAEQYEAALQVVEDRESSPGVYSGMGNNCVDFALEVAAAAGQSVPGSYFSGISEPVELESYLNDQQDEYLRNAELHIIPDSEVPIDLDAFPRFHVDADIQRFPTLEYQWELLAEHDGETSSYPLVSLDLPDRYHFSRHNHEVHMTRRITLLLAQQHVTSGTLRCHIRSSETLERVIELPIEIQPYRFVIPYEETRR